MTGRAITRTRRGRRLVPVLALGAVLAAGGCSGGGKDEERGVPAAQLCHSSLDSAARKALDTLSRDEEFEQTEEVSFEAARDRLAGHEEIITSRTRVCRVHSPRSTPQDPLFEIEFARSGERADWDAKEPGDTDYPLGERARANDAGATLAFPCRAGLPGKAAPTLVGHVDLRHTDAHAELSGADRGRAAMALLHSVSRAMAETMGCGAEAKLPARLPSPAPSPASSSAEGPGA